MFHVKMSPNVPTRLYDIHVFTYFSEIAAKHKCVQEVVFYIIFVATI